jgi:hypothetical protein
MNARDRVLKDLDVIEQDMKAGGDVAHEAFRDLLSDGLNAAEIPHRESRRIVRAIFEYIEAQR